MNTFLIVLCVLEIVSIVRISAYKLEPRTNSLYKFHTDSQSWPSALATCAQEGGYLAIINSDTEALVFKELYETTNASLTKHIYENVLLGFTYREDVKAWVTIQGQTIKDAGYDKWDIDQPDNESALCGGMFEDGLLDNLPCCEERPFICEKDPHRNNISAKSESATESESESTTRIAFA